MQSIYSQGKTEVVYKQQGALQSESRLASDATPLSEEELEEVFSLQTLTDAF